MFLTAREMPRDPNDASSKSSFVCECSGLGVGDIEDAFALVNANKLKDIPLEREPIKYGTMISMKAVGARDKFVGTKNGLEVAPK
jgi:hypothetical protein